MKKIIMLIGCLCFLQELLAQQNSKPKNSIHQKVEWLLKQMTLDEKIGQMNQYNGFWDVTGPAPIDGDAKEKYEHLKKGLVGSMLNVHGVENVRKLQEIAVNETRLGIPLIFGFDVIHGHKTILPIPLALASSWDLNIIEQSSAVAAAESAAMGINWTFAPMMDICRDARWGRVMEGAGEDPFLTTQVALAQIKGFQGKNLAATNTIAATAKHFAGYGFSESGKDYNTVDVSTTTLYNIILPPFKASVQAGVKTVMNSFNVMNGVPATANKFLMKDVLKNGWGFKGVVVSDWSSGVEMIAHGYAKDLKDVAMKAANAGSDMDMESYAYVHHLKQLVQEGKVSVAVIDDAVRRILKLKFELGLFDDPFKYCNEEREKTVVNSPAHHAIALEAAKKSIVLLKNQNNILPLSTSQKNIAVIGALAADDNSPLGSWRVGSDDHTAVSVVKGLQNLNINFNYAAGPQLINGTTNFIQEVNINTTDTTGMAAAVQLAAHSDIVIMVLGEHGYQSGEGRSRANLDLPGLQQQLLEAVHAVNKNIVLVLMNGRPLTIPWAAKNIPAIVEAWQLGTQTGNAVAEVLFGKYNPSGKLPMSFPKSVGQLPIYYNHFSTGRPGPKKEVFWSHYSDEVNEPLYPFGYGLSFTQFKYENLKLTKILKDVVEVSIDITNVGERDGEEVVQLYIHDKVASIVRPIKELKGFKKVMLKAKEKQTIYFQLTNELLGFYNENGKFIVEPGEFEVMIGGNSQDLLKTSFHKK